ncbi:MAG: tetratricopeptide repeat protein [Lysobacteraceae bacterium]
MDQPSHVFDATAQTFEREVIQRSLQVPVLVQFWAEWCGPCKAIKPVLEKLAGAYGGAFELARVDVDAEQQLAAALQIRSVPTVMLVKGGQLVDGFAQALPEGQLKAFLAQHGIEPEVKLAGIDSDAGDDGSEAQAPPPDPAAEVARLRQALAAEPGRDELKLDLALALLRAGEGVQEAERLLEGLPANLATDDRARSAQARLGFARQLDGGASRSELESRLAGDPADHDARHRLGLRLIVDGEAEAGLEQLIALLQADRDWNEGTPRKALIDAFTVIEDAALVSRYRRRMSSILF